MFRAVDCRSGASGFAVLALGAAVTLGAAGCVFSPQTARQVARALPVQRVEVSAWSWEFAPTLLLVKTDAPVELVVTSTDVLHGMEFPDLKVPVEMVRSGRTQTVKFTPDKPGVYNIRCSVPCGEGHSRMWGLLIVQE